VRPNGIILVLVCMGEFLKKFTPFNSYPSSYPSQEFNATKKAFLSECIQSFSHVVQFLGVCNPGGRSRLPVLVMERIEKGGSYVSDQWEVPKHSDLCEVVYVGGCVYRIVAPALS